MGKINRRNFRRDLLLFLCVLSVCFFNISFVFITLFVKIVPSEINIKIGDTSKVVIEKNKYFPLSFKPIFMSDNEEVASVDEYGNIIGVGEGVTSIRSKVGLFEISSKTKVIVDNTLELGMSPSVIIIGINGTSKVEARQSGEPHVEGELLYVSSDESVATVDNEGNIRGIKEGEAIITGKYGDVEAGTTNVFVTSNSIGKSSSTKLSLKVNEKAKINSNVNFNYVSSNNDIVTVDSEGNIKGIGVGEADIIISDGYGIISTTRVSVSKTETQQDEIVIDENNIIMEQKESKPVEANLLIIIGALGITLIIIISFMFMIFKGKK